MLLTDRFHGLPDVESRSELLAQRLAERDLAAALGLVRSAPTLDALERQL